jgi:hypothetical protein
MIIILQAELLGILDNPSSKPLDFDQFKSQHPDIKFIHRERTHNTHIKQYSVLTDHQLQNIPEKWKTSKRKIWVCNKDTGFLEVKASESAVFYSESKSGNFFTFYSNLEQH